MNTHPNTHTTCPHCGGDLNTTHTPPTPPTPQRPSFRPRPTTPTYRTPTPLPDPDDTDLTDCPTCRHMHRPDQPCNRARLPMPPNFRDAVHVFTEPS